MSATKADKKSKAKSKPAAEEAPVSVSSLGMPSLQRHYNETVVPELIKSLGYKNKHQVPRIEKIIINHGFNASLDKGGIDDAVSEVTRIAGQKPVLNKARKSISNFKLREGVPIGLKVTLRARNMYDFLYRLIAISLPGIRDFRGIPAKFDGKGNYTLGITDHSIFPEIVSEGSRRQIGMDICIVTSADSDDEGRELLKLMGMPFRKKSN